MLMLTAASQAQNALISRFKEAMGNRDTTAMKAVLMEWGREDSLPADYYAARFNYYLLGAMTGEVALTTDKPHDVDEALVLTDSTGNVAGYMYEKTMYGGDCLQQAMDAITEGIGLYPDRLDLRFGMVHLLMQMSLFEEAVDVLKTTLEQSAENGDAWLWTADEPVEDGTYMMTDSYQTYFNNLFQAEQDSLGMALVDCVLARYPDNVVFKSDKAALLAMGGDNEKALELFLSIHRDAPDDEIVMSNIAHLYRLTGDRAKAVEYYKRLAQSDDSYVKEQAEEALKELEAEGADK